MKHTYPGRVLAEVQHSVLSEHKTGAGKRPQLDFAVTGADGRFELAVETKWVSKSRTLLRDMIRDVVRLDLMIPHKANAAILVLAGQKREMSQLFRQTKFLPHPDHLNSRPVLPLGKESRASVRFVPVPRYRERLYSDVLESFQGVEVSRSIQLERSGPYPSDARAHQYEVYVWRIIKYDEQNHFLPETVYQIQGEA